MLPCGIACFGCRNRFRELVYLSEPQSHRPAARPEHGSALRPEKDHSTRAVLRLSTAMMWRSCGHWWAPALLPALAGTLPQFGDLLASPRGPALARPAVFVLRSVAARRLVPGEGRRRSGRFVD